MPRTFTIAISQFNIASAPLTRGFWSPESHPEADFGADVDFLIGLGAISTTGPVVTITNVTPTVAAEATLQMTVTVTNALDTSVTWSVVTPSGGSISVGGLYTAPVAAGSYVVRATSVEDITKYGNKTVVVT